MAMVFHCSSLHGPPLHSSFFSTIFRFHGNPGMLASDPGKTVSFGRESTSRQSNTCCWLLPRESSIQVFKSRKTCIQVSQQHSENIPQGLYVNQKGKIARFPAIPLLLTNVTLMGLAMPLDALAETCEANNSVYTMPLLLFVAIVGATVGGLLARQRKGELLRLNEQLRQINAALRRQAKIESYAPALSYAPVGGKVVENEPIVDPTKEELISRLKTAKNHLRNLEPEKAYTEFKTALDLARDLKDPIEEKKAARGVGASLQRQGQYREAIKYHKMVLGISKRVKETSGNTEAYGAIADCYTELGDLENAAKFYDKYIARLEVD